MPLGRERTNDLVEHWNSELGKFSAVGAVTTEDFPREWENYIDAVQRRLLITFIRRKMLGGDTGQQLNVKFPRGLAIGIAWSKLAFEEANIDLKAGQPPFFQKVASFHEGQILTGWYQSKAGMPSRY